MRSLLMYIHAYIHTHIHTYTYVYIYVCLPVCLPACLFVSSPQGPRTERVADVGFPSGHPRPATCMSSLLLPLRRQNDMSTRYLSHPPMAIHPSLPRPPLCSQQL